MDADVIPEVIAGLRAEASALRRERDVARLAIQQFDARLAGARAAAKLEAIGQAITLVARFKLEGRLQELDAADLRALLVE